MSPPLTATATLPPACCGLLAHAGVRLCPQSLQAMRRAPLGGPGEALPVSSLKHLDDQTLAALAALRLALGDVPAATNPFRDWGVLAAPRHLGQSLIGPAVARFHEEGAWGVSPHLIPHHSLHSLSGTLSQFLKAQGPNFGVGGEAELLLCAAALLADRRLPGLWLVLTRVEPDLPREVPPHARCEAVALALAPAGAASPVRLEVCAGEPAGGAPPLDFDAVAALGTTLARRGRAAYALGDYGRLTLRATERRLNGYLFPYFPPQLLAG